MDLADKVTTAHWAELLLPHRPVSGLEPGVVIEVEEDLALVYLRNGQTVALSLEDMKWVVLMVLFNQPGQEANFAWMEDLMFDSEQDYRH